MFVLDTLAVAISRDVGMRHSPAPAASSLRRNSFALPGPLAPCSTRPKDPLAAAPPYPAAVR